MIAVLFIITSNALMCHCVCLTPDKNVQNWQKLTDENGTSVKRWLSNIYIVLKGMKEPEYPINVSLFEGSEDLYSISKFDSEKQSWFGWKMGAALNITNLDHLGFLYGTMDENGMMTGSDITYIYPDFKTVLVGEFKNDVMIKAKPGKIIAYKCQDVFLHILTSKPKTSDPTFGFWPSNTIRIDSMPTTMDPFEKKNVYIQTGQNGDSVFAKKSFKKGDLVTYYSGIRVQGSSISRDNLTNDEFWWHQYKNLIYLDGDVFLYVPEEYWGLDQFRASLGHKVNHSFLKANVEYDYVYHPRFGFIMSVVAIRDIERHEELATNYGYECGTHTANLPQWYKDAYQREFGEPYENGK